ncbi:mechanosensitive ion channel domain-containing protein [Stieleria varia]|nr:mechanosensitive ion channel domain-containing protein [Stieleria varia]
MEKLASQTTNCIIAWILLLPTVGVAQTLEGPYIQRNPFNASPGAPAAVVNNDAGTPVVAQQAPLQPEPIAPQHNDPTNAPANLAASAPASLLADVIAKPDAAATSPPINPVTTSPAISAEQIESSLAELEQSSNLTPENKTLAIENYKAAIKNLQTAADSEARLKVLTEESVTVQQRAEQLKQQRLEINEKRAAVEQGLTLQELEQRLPAAELQLSAQKKARQDAESELQARSPRRKEIRTRMATILEKVIDAKTQLRALESAESNPVNASMSARLLTRRSSLEKELPALEAELAKYDAEESADLIRLKTDLAAANVAFTEKYITLLREQIHSAREAAAEESVRMARWEVIGAAPALKVYAEENQELAEKTKALTESLASTQAELNSASELHEKLMRQFSQTRKKVDSVGLSSSVGALLRKQRTTLPDVAKRRIAVADRQKLLNDTQYQSFEYEESYQELGQMDDVIQEIIHQSQPLVGHDPVVFESAARDLMARKREYLESLIRSNGQYFDMLIELDTTEQQVIKLAAEYENYIDERVLWIRSGTPLSAGIAFQASDTWMLKPAMWMNVARHLAADAIDHFFTWLVCLSTVVLLLVRGRSQRRQIESIGVTATKVNCKAIGPTWRAMFLTTVVSAAWPLLCVFIGWRLSINAGDSEFCLAVSQGFWAVGVLWVAFEWMRQACRTKGLADAHFRWPTAVTRTLRREIHVLTYLALPIIFVTAILSSSDGIHERGDMQRLMFILGMGLACYTTYRLLRPHGLLREYLAGHAGGWIDRVKYLIPFVGMSVPLSLGVLAANGYYFTAQTLFWRLFATALFVASMIVLRAVFFRMLMLRRRYLSIEQAKMRASGASGAGEGVTPTQAVAGIVTGDAQADISAHSMQSQRLVSTGMLAVALVGLWMIWVQVLPALSMLDHFPLWGQSSAAQVASSDSPSLMTPMNPTGESAEPTQANTDAPLSDPVTLSDLALAILIAVVTFVLFRNGPGLLEISLLQQLPVDASVRYAITTLVSYAIVLIGIIAACSTIGLQWSQIQWLATALTFGLAFGLQEMFANFVAGLIILLERPIRVGDIVTVDDVTGVVSRIRIRATSITNWDRKEYVVPNKEFITGRLLNWTLSDKVNRVVIEVGLAYGSDTETARELLLQAADNHPMVLKDPAPVATFEGFGDNSLNLVLRSFLPSLENRLQVIHELHTTIDQAFRKAGLEIAFPQRDLHIRTVPNSVGIALDPESILGLPLGRDAENRDAA